MSLQYTSICQAKANYGNLAVYVAGDWVYWEDRKMKTVGVIGGLGPETTARFYQEVIALSLANNHENYPKILIYSVPLPLNLERECIINAKNEEKCVPFLIKAAQTLEKAGADFVVMPCNSLHVFIKEIRSVVKIPILSIVEETVKFLKGKNVRSVGVLATTITINRRLYENKLIESHIKQILPSAQDQEVIGEIIYHLVSNNYTITDKKNLNKIISQLDKKKVDAVILACTDLQLVTPKRKKPYVYDTMQILVDATVRYIVNNDSRG